MEISLSRGGVLLLISIILVCEALFSPSAAAAHGEMSRGPLPAELRGTYLLASGELLTFTGQYGMPSYELLGQRVFLRPAGDDRFIAWDDAEEALVVERDAAGRVVGVTLVRAGRVAAEGTKVQLYRELDVTLDNGQVALAGSVLLPEGDGPHPAVVIVHGAEAATRESYRLLASHFARRGVAALVYDKRGIGESGGSFRSATFDDLAGDALAGLQLLRGLPGVDPGRVGMLGLSQGAWVIAMAAASSDDVAFLVPVSASGFSPAIQDRWLNGNIIAHRQLNAAVNRASERAWRMLLSTRELVDAGLMSPMPDVPGFWFHALDSELDSAVLWQSVRQPVLGVWGELDCQLPAHQSLARVKDALDRGGHTNYTLAIIARADHSISLVAPCAQETSGWGVLRFDYPEAYFGMLAEWVHEHRAPSAPVRRVVQPDDRAPSDLGWHQAPTAGAGRLGSFLPQVGLMLGLLTTFAALATASTVSSAMSLVRRRPVRFTLVGAVAPLGFVASVLAMASLVELLMLGSPEGGLLIGGPLVLGFTPLFGLATATVTTTLVLGAMAIVRARFHMSARVLVSLAALLGLAVWSSHWAMNPVGIALA